MPLCVLNKASMVLCQVVNNLAFGEDSEQIDPVRKYLINFILVG